MDYNLYNKNIYLNRDYTAGDLRFGVDMRPGMETLADYVVGGTFDAPSMTSSQNPFDVAMRSLSHIYNTKTIVYKIYVCIYNKHINIIKYNT